MRLYTIIFTSAILISGCSGSGTNNDESDQSSANGNQISQSVFEGNWILTDYTLDDGTAKNLPFNVRNGAVIGIDVSSANAISVRHALCGSYEINYQLNNNIVITTDPIYPEQACTGFYDDTDNDERSEILERAFLNTQTQISLNNGVLAATKIRNETLNFVRFTVQ